MLSNVKLKKALKNTIFPFFTLLNKLVPKRDDIILLYSGNKGINNCLLPLRKYLLDKGYDKRYKIYCGIENLKYADDESRVKYITQFQSIWLFLRTAHVFYTTGQIPIKPIPAAFFPPWAVMFPPLISMFLFKQVNMVVLRVVSFLMVICSLMNY